jgi:polysaccharide biosynthesis transport protein
VGAARNTPVLLEYWLIIQRRRWAILGIVMLALVAALVATLLMTPQYTARARLEISRQQQRVTNVEGVDARDAGRDEEFYETQYALLRARSVAERVARTLRLASNPEFFEAHGAVPAGSEALGDGNRPPTREQLREREEQAIGLLQENVLISPLARSSLVDISYTSASPALSANIANAWAQQFIADSIDRRFASTADARRFLENRLNELRGRVQRSERELVNYANRNGIIVFEERSEEGRTTTGQTLTSTQLEAMNRALQEATAERVAAQARASTQSRANAASLTNPTLTALRQRRAEAAANYAQMMVQFEPGYPPARALREQMQTLDSAIAREESRIASTVNAEYRAAVAREQALQQRVSALTQALVAEEHNKIQYNIIQNDVDTNRELYDGLLQRYREIGVAGVSANNIAIVDQAQVPSGPSSPNLPLNLAIALVAGLGLAGAAILVLEQFDEGLRHPSDVNRLLRVPLLGSVPDVGEDEALDLLKDPKSTVSEAYLTVRSNLAFSTDHGVPKSFLVTSTTPGEGKSTTSVAIASVLARTGKRVLLVDADMRSPSLHHFFGVEGKPGFSSYLAGEQDWEKLIQRLPLENLSLMSAGMSPPSAAELLSTDRPRQLITSLLQAFDHVVVDSPPLLGLADAPLLSRATEGVVYVVEAEGVAARGVNASLDRLRASQAHLLGVVLTKLKMEGSLAYGYGYEYGYGLKYGDSSAAEAAR